jgi:hypothetical protein
LGFASILQITADKIKAKTKLKARLISIFWAPAFADEIKNHGEQQSPPSHAIAEPE